MIFLFVFRPPPLPHDTPWSPSYGNRAVPLQKVCVCVRACIFDSSPIIPPSTRGHPGGGDSRPFRRLSPQETLPLPNLEPEKEKRKQKHLFDLHVCSEERREGSPSLSARLVGSLREWPIRRGGSPQAQTKAFCSSLESLRSRSRLRPHLDPGHRTDQQRPPDSGTSSRDSLVHLCLLEVTSSRAKSVLLKFQGVYAIEHGSPSLLIESGFS